MSKFIAVLHDMVNCGFPSGTAATTIRRVRIMAVMSLLPTTALLVFMVYNTLNDKPFFTAINFTAAVILSGNYLYLYRRKNVMAAAVILSLLSLAVSLYLLLHGGAESTGYVWCLFFPITVAFVLGERIGTIVNGGFFLLASVLLLLPDNPLLLVDYSSGLKVDFLSALAGVSLIAWYSERVRRSTEHRLSYNERRFRALIETSSSVYAIVAPDGTVLYESPSLTRVYGYTPEELVGKNIIELVHPDDISVAMRGMQHLIENPAQEHTIEVRYRHKNGSWRTIEVCGINLIDDPAVSGIILSSHDITDLRVLTDRLEERVRQRTEELRRSENSLHHVEKMQAIGQLAGGIAHDFNNQLTGIMGCADWLRISLDNDPEHRECAEAILTAARNAAALTSQLLVFARRGQGEMVPVNLHSIVGDVVKLLERSIDRRVRIEQHLTARRVTVLGDRAQLQSALLNIALNARDAMPEGGTISIRTETVTIGSGGQQGTPNNLGPGTCLALHISDTGIGIAPEVAERIFEPFFTTKPQGAGTGMGLAAVYGTVQQHGGQLVMSSEPGEGTSFTVYLPTTDESSTSVIDDNVESTTPNKGSGVVLVIDDDESVARMLKVVLGKMGYAYYRCINGDEAVAWYERSHESVRVVILDMVMPGMSAAETFTRLRAINPDARVIISSGYSLNNAVQDILEAGALCFVKKPYEIAELTRRLAEATGGDDRGTDATKTNA